MLSCRVVSCMLNMDGRRLQRVHCSSPARVPRQPARGKTSGTIFSCCRSRSLVCQSSSAKRELAAPSVTRAEVGSSTSRSSASGTKHSKQSSRVTPRAPQQEQERRLEGAGAVAEVASSLELRARRRRSRRRRPRESRVLADTSGCSSRGSCCCLSFALEPSLSSFLSSSCALTASWLVPPGGCPT